ncbi:MAG: putative bifunctional diguanylate cyclase/phosphodiesterase [Alishewanella aestuarii]
MQDELFQFAEESAGTAIVKPELQVLKLLIVDDDQDVHNVTELLLRDLVFDGYRLQLLHAFDSKNAFLVLQQDPEIAIVLLDVVMESDDAGLQLVKRIRETLNRRKVRIILRTGQPGYAPELETIVNYDINDYKTKTELTRERLFTCLMAAARSYLQLAQLERLAFDDHLTGLHNRNGLLNAMAIATASGKLHTLQLIDLDHFSVLNDTFGNELADQYLQQVALRLLQVPSLITAARLAADKFALLSEAPVSLSEQLLRQQLSQPAIELAGVKQEVSCCLGIATTHADISPSETLSHAYMALKKAKQSGIGQTVVFNEAMIEALRQRVDLLSSLNKGLEHDQLYVVYQPQFDLNNGQIVGVEALARWVDETGRHVSPAIFIELAEQAGLIHRLGLLVLQKALRDCAPICQALPDFRLAVNVSSVQFKHPDFLDLVLQTIAESGVPAQQIEIELTESAAMDFSAETEQKLAALRAAGITLAIDDFGTGFSSLAYLEQLQANCLKIDRSFTNKLTESESGLRIVQTILTLGHRLQMRVLAEGIEYQSQLNELKAMGCDEGQGYLLAKPMPLAALLQFPALQQRLSPT